MSLFSGKRISFIKPVNYGLEIWITGGVISVIKPENIELVNKLIREAKQAGADVASYVQYILEEEYGW